MGELSQYPRPRVRSGLPRSTTPKHSLVSNSVILGLLPLSSYLRSPGTWVTQPPQAASDKGSPRLSQAPLWSKALHCSLSLARCGSPHTQHTPCFRRFVHGSPHFPRLQFRHGTSARFVVFSEADRGRFSPLGCWVEPERNICARSGMLSWALSSI